MFSHTFITVVFSGLYYMNFLCIPHNFLFVFKLISLYNYSGFILNRIFSMFLFLLSECVFVCVCGGGCNVHCVCVCLCVVMCMGGHVGL